jgi:hypothetical protein
MDKYNEVTQQYGSCPHEIYDFRICNYYITLSFAPSFCGSVTSVFAEAPILFQLNPCLRKRRPTNFSYFSRSSPMMNMLTSFCILYCVLLQYSIDARLILIARLLVREEQWQLSGASPKIAALAGIVTQSHGMPKLQESNHGIAWRHQRAQHEAFLQCYLRAQEQMIKSQSHSFFFDSIHSSHPSTVLSRIVYEISAFQPNPIDLPSVRL